MNWYIKSIKNYVNFKGRAQRKEYWMFILFNAIIVTVVSVLDSALGLRLSEQMGILSSIYGLFIWLPSLSLSFRRLHDVNKSAWWLCIGVIPVVGWIWLLVYAAMDGTPGMNKYGDNPKGV